MSFFRNLIFPILITCCLSCGIQPNRSVEQPTELIISEGLQKPIRANLSEIVNKLEYVSLGSGSDVLIGTIQRIQISDNYILILANSRNNVFLFDRNGNFVKEISKIGHGPGEFLKANQIALSPDEKTIAIHCYNQRKIIVYDVESDNIREFNVGIVAIDLTFLNNFELLISITPPFSILTDYFSLATINIMDWSIKPLRHHKKNQRNWVSLSRKLRYYNDSVLYFNPYNNTYYRVSHEGKLNSPTYFNLVDHELQFDAFKSEAEYNSILDEKAEILKVFKLANLFFLEVRYKKRLIKLVYNLYTGSSYMLDKRKNENYVGFLNDIDGGFHFWPKDISFSGELFTWVDAYTLTSWAESNKLSNLSPRDLHGKEILDMVVANLNEDDNPVIIIAKSNDNEETTSY